MIIFELIRITCQAACHGKTEHGMAKLNMAYLSSLKNRAKLLLSSLPVSPSRVLRAPGTSPYHLVPEHLRATWPRPEQSHLLPEACSPNGTDNRQQRQRRTKRPPPEPSDILKRFYALYDDKLRYYMKKAFKLNCVLNPFLPTVPQVEHSILAKIAKKFGQKWVNIKMTFLFFRKIMYALEKFNNKDQIQMCQSQRHIFAYSIAQWYIISLFPLRKYYLS